MAILDWGTEHVWGALAVAGATAVTWVAWLGWDTGYRFDPVTGERTGPYVAWQVVGCVLCLIAITVVGALVLPPWIPPIVLTVTFTVVWTWWAAARDGSGLWAVGATMVFVGLAFGSTLVSAVTWAGAKVLSR
jgi:hypothetical protein